MSFINCTIISHKEVECNGTRFEIPENRLTTSDEWFWIYLGIYVALVLLAGLVSGLTMGLLSLDMMTLRILKDGGTPNEQKYATRILPVVSQHHLLLVTLLLANAVAVEAMPICLDKISGPITAIAVSVSAVLLFGEVFPQALCTRYGLAIGATLAPFVYVLMFITFVISWPLSKLLDCMLGKEHTTFFRRAQLKVLVDLHGRVPTDPSDAAPHDSDNGEGWEEPLSTDEVLIIKGALDMKFKTVKDAMLPISDVYMLSIDTCLDGAVIDELLRVTHSRIPIYEGSKQNIIGLILVKKLIKLSPATSIHIRNLIGTSAFHRPPTVRENTPLFDVLNLCQSGKCHLCVVLKPMSDADDGRGMLSDGTTEDLNMAVQGIITLEDVIEELIQEEIIDETDVYVDIRRRIRVAQAKMTRQISNVSYQSQNESSLERNADQTHQKQAYNRGNHQQPISQDTEDSLIDLTDATAPLLSTQALT